MDGLRKFIAVDSHEAVKVGGLHQETKSIRVVEPKFTTDFPGAVYREGADELVLRAHEKAFIDTSKVEDQKWGVRQTRIGTPFARFFFFKGIEGQEWDVM